MIGDVVRIFNIGGRSLVYNSIRSFLADKGYEVLDDFSNPGNQIDLSLSSNQWIIPDADVYIIWAGQTNIKKCEENPARSYFINVSQTKILIDIIARRKSIILYPSSNLVFSECLSFATCDDQVSPRNQYAKQKIEVERHLSNHEQESLNYIVRLTKVWNHKAPFLMRWEEERLAGKEIWVAQNRFVSPILPSTVASVLDYLIKNQPKIDNNLLHLGASFELSYESLARKFYAITNTLPSAKLLPIVEQTTCQDGKIYNSLKSTLPEFDSSQKIFWERVTEDARVEN